MKIAITGATGLVGRPLVERLRSEGHTVVRITRSPREAEDCRWDPQAGEIDTAKLEGVGGFINLAGENLADGRWSEEKKRKIRESRIQGTRLLARTAIDLDPQPEVFISASAMGYYPANTGKTYDEGGPKGQGFLADVCAEWEAAASPVSEAGIRLLFVRVGTVLSDEGGVLDRLLPIFRKGVGGKVGSGDQHLSWISRDDLVRLLQVAIDDRRYAGIVNGVAPQPVTNAMFARTLGDVLDVPTRVPVPAFAVKLAFGEMAEATVLADLRVTSRRLPELGFRYNYPEIKAALRREVSR